MGKIASLLSAAKDAGFTEAGTLDCSTLEFQPEVRQMCSADLCRSYAKSWSCPPACGTLEKIKKRADQYTCGILVQTVAGLEDSFDYETMMETEKIHNNSFLNFTSLVLKAYPNAFPMGAGACRLCDSCNYPDAPCRFPKLVFPSMEACGLFVSRVCEKNSMKYNYGKNTISFTSCYLLY